MVVTLIDANVLHKNHGLRADLHQDVRDLGNVWFLSLDS